jgi:hypothetical protein
MTRKLKVVQHKVHTVRVDLRDGPIGHCASVAQLTAIRQAIALAAISLVKSGGGMGAFLVAANARGARLIACWTPRNFDVPAKMFHGAARS